MGIHSRFLVHWTGAKDIEKHPDAEKPQLYVERLKDYLQNNGLYTKRTNEDTIRKKKIKRLIRICFTEIRLSQARVHAERYGKLGIGFARDFIMNKGGRPVIYIPFEAEPGGRLLEDSLENVYEKTKGDAKSHRSSEWILAHVKRMSNGKDEDYYEEMEWRIVHDESPNNKHFKAEGDGVHRLTFAAHDIKVIIFPNEDIKQLSLKDELIREHLSEHMPIMATLEECSNF